MCKKGNYFIAMYDKNDNYICDFNSIEECALYFKKSTRCISQYLFHAMFIEDKYQLFKISDVSFSNNLENFVEGRKR